MGELHTIILQTKNRAHWLKYSLNLYTQYKFEGKIAIIDGSNDEIYKENSEIISSLKEKLSIEHIREKTSFHEIHKNKNLSLYNYLKNSLKTPYFSHVPDDDVFFPKFAKTAINFLEKNENFSAMTGIEVNLIWNKNYRIKDSITKIYSEFIQEDPLDRMLHYSTDMNRTLPGMGVIRSSILKDLFKLEEELKIKPFCRENIRGLYYYEQEMPLSFLCLISGKIKVSSNSLMLFRNRHQEPSRVSNLQKNEDKNIKLRQINLLLDNSMSDFLKEHFEELFNLIKNKTKYKQEAVEIVIKKIIWQFIITGNINNIHSEEIDYSTNLIQYRSNFMKYTVSVPNFFALLKPNKKVSFYESVILQLKNKLIKYYVIIKIILITTKEKNKFIKLSYRFFKN